MTQGGFSGSGKTRLVESLRAQVDVAGGYIVTLKFDAISTERPLLEVVSAFNGLCLLIWRKNTAGELSVIAESLRMAFGADMSVLATLLPNLRYIVLQLKKPSDADDSDGRGDLVNFRSVGFVLQRFMRVVSSRAHPVLLFLDDLQWCDSTTLVVAESILSDKDGHNSDDEEGSNDSGSCLLFIGSYRNNEVPYDHAVYGFMDKLGRCGVPSTKLTLFGINYNDRECHGTACGPLS